MVLKNHIGILLLLIIGANLSEAGRDNCFDRPVCNKWWIPTSAALIVFTIGEAIGWIVYLCFIWGS